MAFTNAGLVHGISSRLRRWQKWQVQGSPLLHSNVFPDPFLVVANPKLSLLLGGLKFGILTCQFFTQDSAYLRSHYVQVHEL